VLGVFREVMMFRLEQADKWATRQRFVRPASVHSRRERGSGPGTAASSWLQGYEKEKCGESQKSFRSERKVLSVHPHLC
jgi:hypothetical protein